MPFLENNEKNSWTYRLPDLLKQSKSQNKRYKKNYS